MSRSVYVLVPLMLSLLLVVAAGCAAPSAPPTAAPAPSTVTEAPLPASPLPTPSPTTPVMTSTLSAPATAEASAIPTSVTTGGGITSTEEPEDVPVPSNAGGPGPALSLQGNVQNGAQLFSTECALCHGPEGKGGIKNAGSSDGTVPPLNPIDPALVNKDPQVFAKNVDLFLEHGSAPEGDHPALQMPAWGDQKLLTPQQIADLLAYIISLNKQ